MHLLLLDTETTGLDAQDRLIQVAFTFRENGLALNDNGWVYPRSEFFKPSVPISYDAMAVHHITHEMIEDKGSFADSSIKKFLDKRCGDSILIAHNAKFDLGMLEKEGVKFKLWIDTQRVAMHLLDSPSYKLQYLRYSLGLNGGETAHDAAGDVAVLEKLFDFLYSRIESEGNGNMPCDHTAIINHMITLSSCPVVLRRFNFGQYKGKSFEEVLQFDRQYIVWLYNQEMKKIPSDRNDDLLHTLKTHLKYIPENA